MCSRSILCPPLGGWGGLGMMGWPIMGYGMTFGMFLIPFLFLVLLVAGVYYAFRSVPSPSTQERGRALEIAKERYAKGEITREQYEQLRKDLE